MIEKGYRARSPKDQWVNLTNLEVLVSYRLSPWLIEPYQLNPGIKDQRWKTLAVNYMYFLPHLQKFVACRRDNLPQITKFRKWRRKFVHWSDFQLILNSSWPSDALWGCRSGSTLAQVMACCPLAPSHNLNQCWLIINKRSISEEITQPSITKISLIIDYRNLIKIPRGQWINPWIKFI